MYKLALFAPGLALVTLGVPTVEEAQSESTTVGMNRPPVCCFGGDPNNCIETGHVATIACAGDETTFELDASTSYDPEGEPLQFSWQSCPESTIDDPTAPITTLRIDTSANCDLTCGVRCQVSDGVNTVYCRLFISVVSMPGGCTQTQGGWGTKCSGNNPGCLRDAYFGRLFRNGLVIGDQDGIDDDDLYALHLTSSQAVRDYLPSGGTPAVFTADEIDSDTSAGVFAAQLVAATLNVAFDNAGVGLCTLTDSCDFPNPPGTLEHLVFAEGCVADELVGYSVAEVIAWSNCVISGESLASCRVPEGVTISDLSDALTRFNEEFVDCQSGSGCLVFP